MAVLRSENRPRTRSTPSDASAALSWPPHRWVASSSAQQRATVRVGPLRGLLRAGVQQPPGQHGVPDRVIRGTWPGHEAGNAAGGGLQDREGGVLPARPGDGVVERGVEPRQFGRRPGPQHVADLDPLRVVLGHLGIVRAVGPVRRTAHAAAQARPVQHQPDVGVPRGETVPAPEDAAQQAQLLPMDDREVGRCAGGGPVRRDPGMEDVRLDAERHVDAVQVAAVHQAVPHADRWREDRPHARLPFRPSIPGAWVLLRRVEIAIDLRQAVREDQVRRDVVDQTVSLDDGLDALVQQAPLGLRARPAERRAEPEAQMLPDEQRLVPGAARRPLRRGRKTVDLRERQGGAAVSGLAQPEPEIGIRAVALEGVVQEADPVDGGQPHQRAGQVAEIGLQPPHRAVPRRRVMPEPHIVQGPGRAVGQGGMAGAVARHDLCRCDDAQTRVARHLGGKLGQHAGPERDVVAGDAQDAAAPFAREPRPDVAGLGVAVRPAKLDQAGTVPGAHRRRVVGAALVEHDDAGLRDLHRRQHAGQQPAAVQGRDDHQDVVVPAVRHAPPIRRERMPRFPAGCESRPRAGGRHAPDDAYRPRGRPTC